LIGRKKFEIATGELYNPIKQDTKAGLLREVRQILSVLILDLSAVGDKDRCDLFDVHFILHMIFNFFSSRKAISFSIMDAFRKRGKIQLFIILTPMGAAEIMIHLMCVKLELELFLLV
jgi:hypothetical protein